MGTHPIFESDFDCLTECDSRDCCHAHQIMEGGVARSSIARRVELNREPDLASIDLRGCATHPTHYPKKSPFYSKVEFLFRHPLLVVDYTLMAFYNIIWNVPSR